MTHAGPDQDRQRRNDKGQFAGYDAAPQDGDGTLTDDMSPDADSTAADTAPFNPEDIRTDPAGREGLASILEEAAGELARVGEDTDDGRQLLGQMRYVLECKDPQDLARAADDTDWEWHPVRRLIAWHPDTPQDTLHRLIGGYIGDADEEVACNPSANTETLDHLARTGTEGVRASVAANPSASPKTLTSLAYDMENHVRWGVAANPNTPAEALTHLAYDMDNHVCERVAGNPGTPPETLDRLAGRRGRDGDDGVRMAAASNPNTDPVTLDWQVNDIYNEQLKLAVAQNPGTEQRTLTILATLSCFSDGQLRQAVARHPNSTGRTMSVLAASSTPEDRLAAAGSQATWRADLKKLSEDANPDVRRSASENPRTARA